jgi:hypothetical protein
VWEVVRLAALPAMRFGMTVLYARHTADLDVIRKDVEQGRAETDPWTLCMKVYLHAGDDLLATVQQV